MADDNKRPFRTQESYQRPTMSSGNDPLAELARLIGQTDPFGEFGRDGRGPAQPVASQPAPPIAPERYAAPTAPYATYDRREGFAASDQHRYSAPAPEPEQPYDVPQFLTQGQHRDYDRPPLDAMQQADYGNDYYANSAMPQVNEDIYDDAPPRRRIGVIAIAAVFTLAVIGAAGAFGYRALFGSTGSSPPPVIKADATPSKVVPAASKEPQSNKLIYDRVGERGQGEKLVSREEQPIDLKDRPPQAASPNANGPSPAAAPGASVGSGTLAGTEPKKIRTITIRPDQPQGTPGEAPASIASIAAAAAESPPPAPARSAPAHQAPTPSHQTHQAATPSNAPLSLSPADAPSRSAPMRTASAPTRLAAPPTASAPAATGYGVQVTSQRSEADAQAAYRNLQGKYPNVLGGKPLMIKRADLGAKGVYYRAMVGPFASSGEASALCSNLKAAGGQCIVQRN
jgi:hypothetical protein